MSYFILCICMILGYTILCIAYSRVGLRGKNVYLRYSVVGLVVAHGFFQIYLLYSKWKVVLIALGRLIYFQIGVMILGMIAFVINIGVDRYIISQDAKKNNKYCNLYLDELRLLAKRKGASNDIQDLLKYMTPKKCDMEDEKIENILNNLSDENMNEGYKLLKDIINIREEKLKCR